MSRLFESGKTYNFSVWASEILGTGFNSVLVEGVVGYHLAKRYADVDALHQSVYPQLPTGTSLRPQDLEYLLLRTPMNAAEGGITVIAVAWIKEDSINNASGVNFNVAVREASLEDIERVRLMFAQNNIKNFEINIVTT